MALAAYPQVGDLHLEVHAVALDLVQARLGAAHELVGLGPASVHRSLSLSAPGCRSLVHGRDLNYICRVYSVIRFSNPTGFYTRCKSRRATILFVSSMRRKQRRSAPSCISSTRFRQALRHTCRDSPRCSINCVGTFVCRLWETYNGNETVSLQTELVDSASRRHDTI